MALGNSVQRTDICQTWCDLLTEVHCALSGPNFKLDLCGKFEGELISYLSYETGQQLMFAHWV